MKNDARFRTNVGVATATDIGLRVRVEAYDDNGSFKGRKDLSLKPWGMTQVAVNSFASSFSSGYLILTGLTSSSDAAWVGYATPVDNNSGDSTFNEARTDAQYTSARPYYDQTGWWEGSMSTAQGSANGYAYISQDQSQISLYVYHTDGTFDTRFDGYEDRGTIHLTGMYVYNANCFGSRFVGGNITSESNAIHGNVSIDAEDPYYCVDGTVTMYLSPISYFPFKVAAEKSMPVSGGSLDTSKPPGKEIPELKRHVETGK